VGSAVWKLNEVCRYPLILFSLIAVQKSSIHPQTAARPPSGPTLLMRVLLAEDQIPFEATQTVIFHEGNVENNSQATITHEIHLGQNRSKIEYKLPKSVAGKLVVNDGHWQWEYDPASRRAIRSETKWQPMTKQYASLMQSRVLRSYRLTVDRSVSFSGGRSSYILHLDPKVKDRQRQEWTIDVATGLVVSREVYDTANRLHSLTSFSSIQFLGAVDARKPIWQRPEGVIVTVRTESSLLKTHAKALKAVPGWVVLMRSIGSGYEFECARILRMNDSRTAHIEYSDGLIGVSLVQVPDQAMIAAGDTHSRTIQIGTRRGTLTHQSRYTVLTWNSVGHTFSLIADLPESTLTAIARSLP
jgi:outer membrane lipoprotein-sorting protein